MQKIYKNALKAIKQEIYTYPCLGLVSKINSGSHKDMNYKTFLKSFKVLKKLLKVILLEKDNIDNFQKLKEIGFKFETEMFKKTKNINTHKGLIFSFSIFFLAYLKNDSEEKIISFIKDFCSSLVDFDYSKTNTVGSKLFIEKKIRGARFVAISGYEIVFQIYKFYINKIKDLKISKNFKNFILLVKISTLIEDTTLINKIGLKQFNEFIANCNIFLSELSNLSHKEIREKILILNKISIDKNISPGGAADLLVLVLFLENEKFVY